MDMYFVRNVLVNNMENESGNFSASRIENKSKIIGEGRQNDKQFTIETLPRTKFIHQEHFMQCL